MQYGTPASEIKSLFERIGDIKDFADLLDKRGMAFITFVSMWTGRVPYGDPLRFTETECF